MNIKNDILTLENFLTNRPDMASYDGNVIQSAIFQTCTFINARCNGMISKVWYVTDPLDKLFRTVEEKDFIVEAFIVQTQYTLNMGNDFTVGSESLSMGGLSGSFQRPVERKEVAPGVDTLLQAAKVFFFQEFSLLKTECGVPMSNGELNDFLTYNMGDARYLQKYQASAEIGSVATVGEGNIINFANPKDLNFSFTQSQRIWDPRQNSYVPINLVETLAFFGQNNYGYGSAVQRGELYNLLAYTTMNWRDDLQYKKDTIIQFAYQELGGGWVVQNYLALRDNTNANPLTSPLDWQGLGSVSADLNQIINVVTTNVVNIYEPRFIALENQLTTTQQQFEILMTTNFNNFETTITTNFNDYVIATDTKIDTKFAETVATLPTIIDTALDALPTVSIENIIFKKDTWYQFKSITDFTQITQEYGLVDNVDYIAQNDYFREFEYSTGKAYIMGHGEWVFYKPTINGSPLITSQDLPRTKLYLKNDNRSSDDGQIVFHRGSGGEATGLFPVISGFWGSSPTRCNNRYYIQMNATVSQLSFTPYYGCWYNVLFLKDVVKIQKAVVRNVSAWGKITGDIQTQTDLVTNFTQKPYVDNLTDTLRTDLGDLGNIVNANTQQIALNKADIVANRAYINSRFLPKKFWIGQQFNFNNATNRDLFYTSNAFTATQASKTGNNVTILKNIEW